MGSFPECAPVPSVEVKRHLIPTAELITRWRAKMSMLTNVNYDDDELGACLVAALQYPDRFDIEFPLCVEHFARGCEGMELMIVTVAMHELLEGLKRLFDRIPLREDNGTLWYMFAGWHYDDMVLDRLPY